MSATRSDRLKITKVIRNATFSDRITIGISTWFCLGLLPGAPGTFGTAGALPLFVAGNLLGPHYQLLFLLILIIGAIWSSHRAQEILGTVDPREIVIDEVAGFLLAVVFLPFTWVTLIAGFLLFRFFDILKPPPIRRIERIVKGGFGVVLDDLVAGAYAHLCVRFLHYIIN